MKFTTCFTLAALLLTVGAAKLYADEWSSERVPLGQRLSTREQEGMLRAIAECWNTGSLQGVSASATVRIAVHYDIEQRPTLVEPFEIQPTAGALDTNAFEAARRAIYRCSGGRLDLPSDRYLGWRLVILTFSPDRIAFESYSEHFPLDVRAPATTDVPAMIETSPPSGDEVTSDLQLLETPVPFPTINAIETTPSDKPDFDQEIAEAPEDTGEIVAFTPVIESEEQAADETGPFLTNSANAAYLGSGSEMVVPVTWDFIGRYASPTLGRDPATPNWFRSLSRTYSQFEEISIYDGEVRLLRTTVPRDSRDTLPAAFDLPVSLQSLPQRDNYLVLDPFRAQAVTALGIDPSNPLDDEQSRILFEWYERSHSTSYLFATQYYDQAGWQPLEDLISNQAAYQFYDLRTVMIMGNQITLTYWKDVPSESVVCLEQLSETSGTQEVLAHDVAAAEQGRFNFFAQQQIDYVQWSLNSLEEVLTMPSCGSHPLEVRFTGFLDYGEGPFIGETQKSFSFESSEPFIPASGNASPQGWEIACQRDVETNSIYNRIIVDCDDFIVVRNQVSAAWLTLVTQGNLVVAQQCREWLTALARVRPENWPPAYPQQYFNRCNFGLRSLNH